MSLATFCDIVMAEIWDDCGAMADQVQYHSIVTQMFVEGKDPSDIWYETTDAKGKKKMKRLSEDAPRSGSTGRRDLGALRELMEQAKAAAQAPSETDE